MDRLRAMCARATRGNYAPLMAATLVAMLGFGGLGLDASYMRMAYRQARDVSDAAAVAALYTLRRTGDTDEAVQAALAVTRRNQVGGGSAELTEIVIGGWNGSTFSSGGTAANSVQVRVAREGDNALPLSLAPVFGVGEANLSVRSTSSTQSLHVIVVLDITSSWDWADFVNARDAALSFYDRIAANHGSTDRIGLTVFVDVRGYEITPLMLVEDAIDTNERDTWANVALSSRPGWYDATHAGYNNHPCHYHFMENKPLMNNFAAPNPDGIDGCFPHMPRNYWDEGHTDHSVGIAMAGDMFAENPDGFAYRAMIVLTDGKATGNPSGGKDRDDDGFVETRWRHYTGDYQNKPAVIADAQAETQALWDSMEVNTWMVSFVADESWMHDAPKGDGYFVRADTSAELEDIFDGIADAIPVLVVD